MQLIQFSLVNILNELAAHNRKYYLTGSRFFLDGQAGSKGDIDLFTEVGINEDAGGYTALANFLENLGFERGQSAYTDMLVVDVYSHKKAGVDIQLVSNADLKRAVQQYLIMHKSRKGLKWLSDMDWNDATINVVKICAAIGISYEEFANRASEKSSEVSMIDGHEISAHYIGGKESEKIKRLID